MCELRDGGDGAATADALDTAEAVRAQLMTSNIFQTAYFRRHGHVSEFCPCSLESIQALNKDLIAPALDELLHTTFFKCVSLLRVGSPRWIRILWSSGHTAHPRPRPALSPQVLPSGP